MAATTVVGAVAGCSGDGGDGGSDGGDGGSDGSGGGVPDEVSEYLSDTDNFDGSLTDMTGQDEVSVAVGAQGNGGAFAFDPPAIRVDSGTTVAWEWTGEGGQHNVVDDGGDFESELVAEEGHTFEHTFDGSGTSLYVCEPHESLGMKGAVVVE